MKREPHKEGHPYLGIGRIRPRNEVKAMKTIIQELIEVLKIHRDTAYEKAGNSRKFTFIEYFDGRAKAFEDAISFAELHLEKGEMKEGTLVWIVASVGDDALQERCDDNKIVVEPHGYKAMPLYADKQWVRPLTEDEIEVYE